METMTASVYLIGRGPKKLERVSRDAEVCRERDRWTPQQMSGMLLRRKTQQLTPCAFCTPIQRASEGEHVWPGR